MRSATEYMTRRYMITRRSDGVFIEISRWQSPNGTTYMRPSDGVFIEISRWQSPNGTTYMRPI